MRRYAPDAAQRRHQDVLDRLDEFDERGVVEDALDRIEAGEDVSNL